MKHRSASIRFNPLLFIGVVAAIVGLRKPARGATINVPADQPTIQRGFDAAAPGDVVLVAPGTYAEHPLLIQPNGPAITVESSGGPSVTTITGSSSGPVVTLGPNVILSGFTITGGVNNSPGGDGGGGVLFEGGTLTGNVITGNSAAFGGAGIEISDAGGIIESNTITNNTGPSGGYLSGIGGGGIFITGDLTTTTISSNVISNNSWLTGNGGGISLNVAGQPTIINNLISGNLVTGIFCPGPCAAGGAIAMEGSAPLIEQNLIINNQADLGAGIYFGVPSGASGPTLINNTFYGNTATQGLGSAVYATGYDGPVGIFNNLIVAAPGQNALYCDYTFNPIPPVIEYNDLYSSGGNAQNCGLGANQYGNFSADPLFLDPGNLDFHLSPGSQAIDAGLTSEASFSSIDYYGSPRTVAGKIGDAAIVDAGASEYQPPAPLPTPTPSATPTPIGNQINVPADYPTIQDAINASSDGDVIMVAPGTYFEAINFEGKAIQVTSTNGPTVTTIDGHGLGPVVIFSSGETRASVLSGFTITSGLALNGLLYGGGGINISDASPTITNNVITNNYACAGGGGIYSYYGSPLIQFNTITQNQQFGNELGSCGGGSGGGLSISGDSPEIIGNIISKNSWTSGDGGGIAISFTSNALLMNNTISGNLATGVFGAAPAAGGGGVYVVNGYAALIQNLVVNNNADIGSGIFLSLGGSGGLLVNNTVSGNQSTQNMGSALLVDLGVDVNPAVAFYNNILVGQDQQNALYCSTGSPSLITNDIFSGGADAISGGCIPSGLAPGNFSTDPMFANAAGGNYQLLNGSIAIDGGTNSAPQLPASDFYGNPRIAIGYTGDQPVVDMGVAEVQTPGPKPSFTPTATPTPTVTPTATPTQTPTPTPALESLKVTPREMTFKKEICLGNAGDSSPSKTLTFENKGSVPIAFGDVSVSGDFRIADFCSALSRGDSCKMLVTFTPTAVGKRAGTLSVNGNFGATTVSLSGEGEPGKMKLSRQHLHLGKVTLGQTGAPKDVTLTNPNDLAISVTNVTVSPGFTLASNSCGSSLPPNSKCALAIAFTPATTGKTKGALTIYDDAKDAPHLVTLSGTGEE